MERASRTLAIRTVAMAPSIGPSQVPMAGASSTRASLRQFGSDINVLLTRITQVCGQQVQIMRAKKKERKKERKGKVEGALSWELAFPIEKYHNREGTNAGELHSDDILGN